MKLKAFAIFDQKAKAFLPPFFLPETAVAVRTFGDCVNTKEHAFGRHPADYTLFGLGQFDMDSGSLLPAAEGIQVVINGVQLLRDEAPTGQLALPEMSKPEIKGI